MTDFRFQIVGDARSADAAIDDVERGLERATSRALAMNRAIEELGDHFGSLGRIAAGGFSIGNVVGAAQQLAAISDEYTELANNALKFTDAGRNTALILDDQRKLADQLNMDLKSTIGAYDAVRDATDDLNLTYDQQIRLTRTLSEAAQISGKSSEAAATAIYNLKVAFDTGQDPGRALIALFKQFPDVASQLSSSLGKSTGEIVQLAKDGKLSFQQLTQGLIQNTDELDRKFGERTALMRHSWDQFRDSVTRPLDLQGTIDQFLNVDMAIQRVVIDAQKMAAQWNAMEEAAIDSRRNMDHWMDVAKQMPDLEKGIDQALTQAARIAEEVDKRRAAAAEKYNNKLKEQLDLARQIGLVGSAPIITQGEQYEAYKRDLEQTVNEEIAAEERAVKYAEEATEAKIKAHEEWVEARNKATDEAAEKTRKLAEEDLERTRKEFEELGQAIAPVGKALLDMFREWDFSAEKFIETLDDVAFQILKLAALQALTGGGAGAALGRGIIGGLATGGSFDVGPGLNLPRAQYGNDWRVTGSGGQDSSLVAFRATPGERVTVQTQAQQRTPPTAMPMVIRPQIVVQSDPREIVSGMGTRAGAAEYVKLKRKFRRS